MDFTMMDDRQLADGFSSHYKKGAIFLIFGLFTSMFIIGIPLLIYGFLRLFKSQQFKNEIQRRVKTEGYNPYGTVA